MFVVQLQGLSSDAFVAPVGQGGEVEVGGVADKVAGGPDAVQSGQRALVHGTSGAVGVGGEPTVV